MVHYICWYNRTKINSLITRKNNLLHIRHQDHFFSWESFFRWSYGTRFLQPINESILMSFNLSLSLYTNLSLTNKVPCIFLAQINCQVMMIDDHNDMMRVKYTTTIKYMVYLHVVNECRQHTATHFQHDCFFSLQMLLHDYCAPTFINTTIYIFWGHIHFHM